jgi:hypothetical protein
MTGRPVDELATLSVRLRSMDLAATVVAGVAGSLRVRVGAQPPHGSIRPPGPRRRRRRKARDPGTIARRRQPGVHRGLEPVGP